MELTIQLAIIMIGNQAVNGILEMVIPLLTKLYNTFKIQTGIEKESNEAVVISCNQWTEDYKLIDLDMYSLFHEYLEMGKCGWLFICLETIIFDCSSQCFSMDSLQYL